MATEQGARPGQDLARFCAQLEDYTPTVSHFLINVIQSLICLANMPFCVDS